MEPHLNSGYPGRMNSLALIFGFLAVLLCPELASAANPERPLSRLTQQTTGGLQFWGDVAFFHQWRIQCNAFTGHFRLLDESNVRRAWGTLEACQTELAEIRRREGLPAMEGEAVLLLHGLGGSRKQMRDLEEFLTETGGYQVFVVGYPSTRGGVDRHAEQLARVMNSLEGIERVHFVAHSLGNLVIRRWMANNTDPETGTPIDARVGRVVMLGPPNQRPRLASYLEPIDPYNAIAGRAGRELNDDWGQLEPTLAIPRREFGIIAGGKGDGEGWNPLIPGDDDFTVGVAETKLAGACDFRVVQVTHRSMPSNPTVQTLSLAFLQNGRFGNEEERGVLEEQPQ